MFSKSFNPICSYFHYIFDRRMRLFTLNIGYGIKKLRTVAAEATFPVVPVTSFPVRLTTRITNTDIITNLLIFSERC